MKFKDINTGQIIDWNLKQVLEEINRDRSEEWTDYDKTDWLEGWEVWCEGDCYNLIW
ncbi:hypothetical protein LCGC14_1027060 [marine sediment metagenome]|uniref:Uncharacterized protein n=1 Tax=marine sediment metagenome TaxID=412755 RepID=A0A0F9QDT5_9ZZZZ